MRCIWKFFHDWSKWETEIKYFTRFYFNNPNPILNKGIDAPEKWQFRICKKCGYRQEKKIH
jgi:hypothetical protein